MRGQKDINELCQLWERSRDPKLAQLIAENGWIADRPLALRVATALLAEDYEYAESGGRFMVEALFDARFDRDPVIGERARKLLGEFTRKDTRDEMCRLVIEKDDPVARAIAVKAGYVPSKPAMRALYYFVTEQWEQYEALDHDHTRLAAAYAAADDGLRKRLMRIAREAGRVEWVTAAAGGSESKRLTEMTESEWEVVVGLLQAGRRHAEMWRLAQLAPPLWAAPLLRALTLEGWEPERASEHQGFYELAVLAAKLPVGQKGLVLDTYALDGIRSGGPVAVSRDGRRIALVDASTVRVYNLPTGELVRTVKVEYFRVAEVAFTFDGKWLVTGGYHRHVKFWGLEGQPTLELVEQTPWSSSCLAMGPEWLAIGTPERRLRLWHLQERRFLADLQGKTKTIDALAFSPDGRTLASGSTGSVQFWRFPEGRFLKSLKGHASRITCMAFAPDGRALVTGGWDGRLMLWDAQELKHRLTLCGPPEGPTSVAFSPDGHVVVSTGRDGHVHFWSAHTGALLAHRPWGRCRVAASAEHVFVVGHPQQVVRLNGPSLSCLLPPAGPGDERGWPLAELADPALGEPDRLWLSFWLALMRYRKRYDVRLEEVTVPVPAGAFDIRLEEAT